MQKSLGYWYIGLGFLLLFPSGISAVETVRPASDIIPTEIIIISPLPDTLVESNTPQIEVVISDLGSGILYDTLRFYVDDISRIDQAIIEQSDVTGQAESQQFKIVYRPKQALNPGNHRVLVSVRDRANNLSEKRWDFQVKGSPVSDFRVGGSNSLQIVQYPVAKVADYFELNLHGQVRDADIRLNFDGHLTNYPSGIPDYSYHDYNFFTDRYTLGIRYDNTEVLLGYAVPFMNSELLQISSEIHGAIINQSLANDTGKYYWSLFKGETGESSGLGISVYDTSGIIGEWESPFGLSLTGYHIRQEDDDRYQYTGLKGNKAINGLMTRFEVVHGSSSMTESAGNAVAVSFDRPLGPVDLGFDYQLLQPDYPTMGAPSSLLLESGGSQRYIFRGIARISPIQQLRFQGALSEDNLDSIYSETNHRQNYYLNYSLWPNANTDWNISYYGDQRHRNGSFSEDSLERNDSLILSFHQKYENKDLKASISWGESTYRYNPDQSSERIRYFTALTIPYPKFNLTPSFHWLTEDKANNGDCDSKELRLTFDFLLVPEISRSTIAIFYYVSDEGTESKTKKNITGLETALYWAFNSRSTLSLIYNHSLWDKEDHSTSSGYDRTLWLEWKVVF